MARQMFDAAYPPSQPPEDCQVAAGYLHGGQATHGWSQAEWQHVQSWPQIRWLLPIRVADPDAGGIEAGVETVREAEALGCPRGVAVALDVEANMAAECARTGFHRLWAEYVAGSGFVPMIYTSRSAQPALAPSAHPGTLWWLAEWDDHPHEIPGAAATQWTSPTVHPGLAVDLSTVSDALPLWPLRGAESGGGHVAPTLNAPICAVVHSPHDGYWLVAEDGGVFAFGAALAFPGNRLPTMHLAAPIVAAATTGKGDGLILVAADGGVFTLGHATFHGSIPGQHKP